MKYQNVCIEAVACTLPEEIVTSEQLEQRLEPLYSRLKLPAGRLELMTGIRQRRFWAPGTLPSDKSVASALAALELAECDKAHVGALVHGSVCRDYLEPATACGVHHRLGLPAECVVYDLSNACLGLLNGMVQVANMIELGQIRAGLVVGTECSRQLVEHTIATLNADHSLTRDDVKLAVASLTIGSASAAVLLVDRSLSRTGNRLLGATARAHSAAAGLCHSDRDEAVAEGMRPLMETDSERLMREGIAVGEATFESFLEETGWSRSDIDKTFCHQVGSAHRKRMLQSLELDPIVDFATLETLGNTGSAALPVTMAMGIEHGHLERGDRVALLGIGSGINALMLAVDWQQSCVAAPPTVRAPHHQTALPPNAALAAAS